MVAWFNKRRLVSLLIAWAIGFAIVKGLAHGTYCLVPSSHLKFEEVTTAEMSIYGVVLYREVGTDHTNMYDNAVWWYEMTLFGIWAVAVVCGTGVYLIVGRFWRSEAAPP
jgi:hypothetical protein